MAGDGADGPAAKTADPGFMATCMTFPIASDLPDVILASMVGDPQEAIRDAGKTLISLVIS